MDKADFATQVKEHRHGHGPLPKSDKVPDAWNLCKVFGYSPLLSLPFLSASAVLTASTVSSLVSVTGVELPKTDISFCPLGILGSVKSLPMTIVTLHLRDIFHFFLDNAGVNTRCRKVVATTTPLALVPKTSLLLVLVLFQVSGRSLLSGRWLLPIRCISKGGVGWFILSGIFLLFFHGLVFSRVAWVYIAGAERWLEHCFYLYIYGFCNYLFSKVQFPTLCIKLNSDKRSQAFLEISNHSFRVTVRSNSQKTACNCSW